MPRCMRDQSCFFVQMQGWLWLLLTNRPANGADNLISFIMTKHPGNLSRLS